MSEIPSKAEKIRLPIFGVDRRMGESGGERVFQGYRDKRPAFVEWLRQTELEAKQVLYLQWGR